MSTKRTRKALSFLLALVFLFSSSTGLVPLPGFSPILASAAESPANTTAITSDEMTVYLDSAFPSVVEYRLGEDVFYGRGQAETANRTVQLGVVTDYSHTSSKSGTAPTNTGMYKNAAPTMTNCTPAVTTEEQANSVTYHLVFSESAVAGVELDVVYQVTDNILEMKVNIVKDENKRVRYVEFPNNALISVRGGDDEVAYNSNYSNLDAFGKVSNLALHSVAGGGSSVQDSWSTTVVSKLKIGHAMLNTAKLAATLEPSITAQYNYIETKGSGATKEVTVRPIDFMLRGPDASLNPQSGVKVVITGDENKDGKINWQDAAVAYRKIMDPLTGENLARKTIAVDILLNYYGKQAWTWENSLDYIKRKALATDDFPQIVMGKGTHRQYGDGHPDFADASPLLGGNEGLNWLTEEAAKYNTTYGLHLGLGEIYKESIRYEGMPIRQQGAWAFVDRFGAQVAFDRVWRQDETYVDIKGVQRPEIKPVGYVSLYDYLYDLQSKTFPKMKFYYLDVSTGNTNGYEARWTGMKTIETFREHKWTYFSEMPINWIRYDPNNDASTEGIDTRYNNWNHTYYYRGDTNAAQERMGSSNIRRFIVNDLAIYGSGTRDLQNILGPGYYKGYGTLGWHEFGTSDNDTVADSVNEFWEHILADTYLKNFQLLSLDMETGTAIFENGVKSVYSSTTKSRTITKDGVVYGVIDNSGVKGVRNTGFYSDGPAWIKTELFMPWDPQTEEKIYAYSTSGNKTFELPKSWQEENVTKVDLYALGQTSERVLVGTYDVSNGKVTLSGMAAKTGYVVYKNAAAPAPVPTVWGDRPPNYASPSTDQTSGYQDGHDGQQKANQTPMYKDGNFNSGRLDYAWELASGNPSDVKVLNDITRTDRVFSYNVASDVPNYYDNFYLRIDNEASVKQTITNLEPGKEYMAYVRVWNEGDYSSTTVERPTVRRKAFAMVETGSGNSVTSESQGYNTKISEHYGFHPMNNWGIIKVYFTAASNQATLIFGTKAGTGAVMFDDVRVYREENPYGKEDHYYKQDFETSSLLGDFIWESTAMARLAWANPSRFYPGEYIYTEQHESGATALMLGGAADTKIKTQPGMLKLKSNTGYDLSFQFKSNAGPAEGVHYTVFSPSAGNILVNQYLEGEAGVIHREKISFRTDTADDYIIVFDNEVNRTAGFGSDLFIDEFTLDENAGAVNPPLMTAPTFEPKSLIEAENGKINGDQTLGALVTNDADASCGKAITRFQLNDEISFGPMAAANRIRIRYKNDTQGSLTMNLLLKGENAGTLIFPPTTGYKNLYFSYTIGKMDYIVLQATNNSTALLLDLLSVSPIYEAESAVRSGNTGVNASGNASGGKYVWMSDTTGKEASMTFTIQHSSTDLVLRHTNEKTANRKLNIYINGALWNTDGPLVFPPTGALGNFAEVRFPIALKPGDVLKLRAPYNETLVAMIDCIMLETDETKLASSLTLDRNVLEFTGQDKERLVATVLPETALLKNVTWMSSNPNVATVSDQGLVRPGGTLGTTTITATLNGGVDMAVCAVTVSSLPTNGVYTNVALNKTATQSTKGNAQTGVDGNTIVNGPFNGGTPSANCWWKVDLGAIYDISETKLYFKPGDRHNWFYKIEYSAADSPAANDPSWTILADFTKTAAPDIPGPHINTLGDPIQARHLRVTMTGVPAGTEYWYTFTEFEAYGTFASTMTNEAAVTAAKTALTWDAIRGANRVPGEVTTNLTLPLTGLGGTSITWSSNNQGVISSGGTVTPPENGYVTVTLTATIAKGDKSDTKTFNLTVDKPVFNLAYGKPVLPLNSNGDEVASAGAGRITDGNAGTSWTATAGTSLRIDLGLNSGITGIGLSFAADTVSGGSVAVAYSADGEHFTPYGTAQPIPPGGGTLSLTEAVQARYLLLTPSSVGIKIVSLTVTGGISSTSGVTRLIIAPHPDDETLAFGGVIKRALADGGKVAVVMTTSGDYNGIANGRLRMKETVAAMELLGLDKSNIYFMTFPDIGGLDSQGGQDFRASMTYTLFTAANPDAPVVRRDKGSETYNGDAGYGNSVRYQRTGAQGPFTRNTFLADLEWVIGKINPDELYTLSRCDLHGDHAALELFVNEAILDMQKRDPGFQPTLLSALVHSCAGDGTWPVRNSDSAGVSPFEMPAGLETKTILDWNKRVSITVPDEMRVVPFTDNLKTQAISKYPSQMSAEAYLKAFAKWDEVFWARKYDSIAHFSTASASSQKPGGYDTSPAKAIDGIRDGYSESMMNSTPNHRYPRLPFAEWVSNGDGQNAWLRLDWNGVCDISAVTLYDRPLIGVQITGGTLHFSDGSTVSVPALPDDGRPLTVKFTEKTGITWLKLEITSCVGTDVGLAEIEVQGTFTPSSAYHVTLSSGEGYRAAAQSGSDSPVNKGGSYFFTVTLEPGYTQSVPVVKTNGENLSTTGNVGPVYSYTISNITTDQTVTVDGVEKNRYTITFVAAGLADQTKAVAHGGSLAVSDFPAVPAKVGYTGVWNQTADFFTNVTADATVTAVYTANYYTVTFDPNGGVVDPANKTVTYGAAYGTLPTPTLDNADKIFDGWFTQLGGGVKVEGATAVTTANNHALFARWRDRETSPAPTVNVSGMPGKVVLPYTGEGITLSVETQLTYTYRWKYSTDRGATWNILQDEIGAAYTIPVADILPANSGWMYLCAVTNTVGAQKPNTVESAPVTLIVGNPRSGENQITAFTIGNVVGVINQTSHTIAVTLSEDTVVTELTPAITMSERATVSPSGPQDFTSAVAYTVTAEDGTAQIYTVTVTVEQTGGPVSVIGVTLDKSIYSLYHSETLKTVQLTAAVVPGNATNKAVTWSSSNAAVATVDQNGIVTALAVGTATITVTTVDGEYTAACTVTVSTYVAPSYNPPADTTKAETKKNGDGSTTQTVTNLKTGAVTETTAWPDGTRLVTTTGKDGKASSEVTIPGGKDSATVTIPTAQRPGPSQVIAIVKPDGSREIVKTSIATEDGIQVTLTEGAKLEIVDNSKRFIDVDTADWFDTSVQFVASRELMGGTGVETFSPGASTSRAMLITILARLDGQDTAAGESWHSVGMKWAVTGGISDGTDPDASITREQLAVILYRYAKAERTEGDLGRFSDADSVSAWAAEAMAWAVERGIIRGANGRLNPTATATRAEVATMLERFMKR